MELMDIIGQTLQQQGGIEQISRQLGIEQGKVETVVSGAVPMMVTALAKNSSDPSGAASLAGALDRDHDGSILDDLAGALMQSSTQRSGVGALAHMFGSKKDQTTSALGTMSGLDSGSVGKILALLAPLVLGALGRSQRSAAPGGSGIDLGSLTAALTGSRREAERRAPQAGVLAQILDSDGDGDVKDDLANLGAGLLGSLFKR